MISAGRPFRQPPIPLAVVFIAVGFWLKCCAAAVIVDNWGGHASADAHSCWAETCVTTLARLLQKSYMSQAGKKSYGQILKSSVLVGGSASFNVLIRVVRAKAVALILGPTGVGLLGFYNSITELTRCVAGMGVSDSGGRQIADAAGSGEKNLPRIAATAAALRRVTLFSGILGAILLFLFCKPVSQVTFGETTHIWPVALLGFAVFFDVVAGGGGAILQGTHRIADLAKNRVLGILFGTILAIPIVYMFRENGIAPAIICTSIAGAITSWWYVRKLPMQRVKLATQQFFEEAKPLLSFGITFMATTFMTLGGAYVVRVLLLRKLDLEAAGCFQAAWALGGLYVGFILQAMGADFFPRLTSVATNKVECNRLVNEQAEMGALIAVPGSLATLTFAPIIVHVFYTSDFQPAVQVLHWICLGMTLRVVSWPMGYMLVAKGERRLFFWSELFKNSFFVALVWFCVNTFGLDGAGIAFFGMYVVYWIGVYFLVRRLSGFRWSKMNVRLISIFVPVTLIVFLSQYLLPPLAAGIIGTLATIVTTICALRTLFTLIPVERLPGTVRRILALFHLLPT